ncbi:hypothetical protein A9Q99_08570 [Gammaproteobacteria bacterium 45_16_T64]|nr:hypothetical protein A9Q99_08570 [Gammaproteobacteria bacterium 45_16_T64]
MKDVSVLYSAKESVTHSVRDQFLTDKACVVDLIEKSGSNFHIRLRGISGDTAWFTGAELIGKGLLPVEIERYCKTELLRVFVGK